MFSSTNASNITMQSVFAVRRVDIDSSADAWLSGVAFARINGVAGVRASEGEVVIKLNPVEQFLALRRSVHLPVSLIRNVSVMGDPLNSALVRQVKMGFAARTAPGRGMICCGPRATWGGGQALLIVYGNSRSVVIELAEASPKWRLIVVSVSDPDAVADHITGLVQPAH